MTIAVTQNIEFLPSIGRNILDGSTFRYNFVARQHISSDQIERLVLTITQLHLDVIDGEINVDDCSGRGTFMLEHKRCFEHENEFRKFEKVTLKALSECFGDIATWESGEALRPAVDPDLISVVGLRELDGQKCIRPGEKSYCLDICAVNQAGLLAHLTSLICQSGFDIMFAGFSLVSKPCKKAASIQPHRRGSIDVPYNRNNNSLYLAPECVKPASFSCTDEQSPCVSITPTAATEGSVVSGDDQTLGSWARRTSKTMEGRYHGSHSNAGRRSRRLSDHLSERTTENMRKSRTEQHGPILAREKMSGPLQFTFRIRCRQENNRSSDPARTLRRVLEFPEPKKIRKRCYLLNRPVVRMPTKGFPSAKWYSPDGPLVETSFSNGDVFHGEIKDNVREGYGVYRYADSNRPDSRKRYEGQWTDNSKHGYGIAYWNNGDAYAGNWVRNKRTGLGVMIHNTRDNSLAARFEGEWLNDLPNGLGVEEKSDSMYFGRFIKGRRCGKGLEVKFREHKYEVVIREAGEGDFDKRSYVRDVKATSSTNIGFENSNTAPRLSTVVDPTPSTTASVPDIHKTPPEMWRGEQIAPILAILGVSERVQEYVTRNNISGEQLLESTDEECRTYGMTAVENLVTRKCLRLLSNHHRVEWSISALNTHAAVNLSEVEINTVLARHLVPTNEIEKVRKISAGGFGTVYEGKWTTHGRVALKEMRGHCKTRNLGELVKEANVSASLNHPNICKFLGICENGATADRYIIYEFMPWSLFDLIHMPRSFFNDRPALTAVTRLEIAECMASAGDYLHSLGVIHADLKSPNVLVDRGLKGRKNCIRAKLCDFGHAAVRPSPRPHNRLGTPHWAAPEALRGEGISYPVDVWAFGVICWEMVKREVPFAGLSAEAVIASVGWGGKIPGGELDMIEKGKRCALLAVATECMQPQVSDRPSFHQLLKRLRKIRLSAQTDAFAMLASWFPDVLGSTNCRKGAGIFGVRF